MSMRSPQIKRCLFAIMALGLLLKVTPAGAEPATGGERIVSLGGDITEILYGLGAGDSIVAVDTTSKYPEGVLDKKPNVGYLRALGAEGVLAANPTLIIASDKAGPPEVIKSLKAANVRYVEIADKLSAEGIAEKIRAVGAAIKAEGPADVIAKKVESDFAALQVSRAAIGAPKRAIVILTLQSGRATVGGEHSSADAILSLAGLTNAATGFQGFKPVSDEQLAAFAPDVVVVMRRVGEQGGVSTLEQVRVLPALQGSPAAKSSSYIEIDGLLLLGFGPRAPQAARDLMKAAYGDHGAQLP